MQSMRDEDPEPQDLLLAPNLKTERVKSNIKSIDEAPGFDYDETKLNNEIHKVPTIKSRNQADPEPNDNIEEEIKENVPMGLGYSDQKPVTKLTN